jgi:putative sterol carrier protein
LTSTPDSTGDFFRELAARGHDPLLGRASGTLRFDLVDGDRVEHWYVTVHKGDVTVSHKNGKADAVLSGDKQLFDGIASGRKNAMTALLREAMTPEGDASLMLSFGRVFPGPPGAADVQAAG